MALLYFFFGPMFVCVYTRAPSSENLRDVLFLLVTSSTKMAAKISEVLISTEEMFSGVGSESMIHPSYTRAFSEGWVLGIHG